MNLKKKIKSELNKENQTNVQFETIASQNGFTKDLPLFHKNGYKIATCILSILLMICLGFMIIQNGKEKTKTGETSGTTNSSFVDKTQTNEPDGSPTPPLDDKTDDNESPIPPLDDGESNNDSQTITNEEIEQKADIVDQIIKNETFDKNSESGAPSYNTSSLDGLNIQDIITGVFITNVSSIQNKGEIAIYYDENHETESSGGPLKEEKIYFYISKIVNPSGVEEEYLMIKSNIYNNYQIQIVYPNVNQKVTLINNKMQMVDKITFNDVGEIKVEVTLYLEDNLVDTYEIEVTR